jgi:hypothetical protein
VVPLEIQNCHILRETPRVVGHLSMAIWCLTIDIIRAEFNKKPSTSIFNKIDVMGWKYPPSKWMKLNVDGYSKGNPGYAVARGLIRDCMGS